MKDFFTTETNNRKDFLNPLSLQTSSRVPQIPKRLFTAKSSFSQQRYIDLDIFRLQIEESKAGLHHLPYTNNKKNTTFYKSVFLGFASLFLVLNITTMAIPSALGCGFLFSSCTFLKGIIVSVCTFLSATALTIALRLKAEKEAVVHSVRKAKAHTAAIYARKKVSIGIKNVFSLFGPGREKAAALRQLYQDTCDKINDKKDETLHLVHRIATAETLDLLEKEDLLNQAIEEFNEKLHQLTQTFRHAKLIA